MIIKRVFFSQMSLLDIPNNLKYMVCQTDLTCLNLWGENVKFENVNHE